MLGYARQGHLAGQFRPTFLDPASHSPTESFVLTWQLLKYRESVSGRTLKDCNWVDVGGGANVA
jgi:hypothetical protein